MRAPTLFYLHFGRATPSSVQLLAPIPLITPNPKARTSASGGKRVVRIFRPLGRAAAAMGLFLCGSALAFGQDTARATSLGVEGLTLAGAQRLAKDRNRDLRAAERAVAAAQAGVVTAEARQNPNFTLQTSNINPQAGLGAGGLRDKAFDTQFRIDYLLERGGKRDLRLATANAVASRRAARIWAGFDPRATHERRGGVLRPAA